MSRHPGSDGAQPAFPRQEPAARIVGARIDLAERDVFEFGGAHCDRVVANVLSRLADEDDQPFTSG